MQVFHCPPSDIRKPCEIFELPAQRPPEEAPEWLHEIRPAAAAGRVHTIPGYVSSALEIQNPSLCLTMSHV